MGKETGRVSIGTAHKVRTEGTDSRGRMLGAVPASYSHEKDGKPVGVGGFRVVFVFRSGVETSRKLPLSARGGEYSTFYALATGAQRALFAEAAGKIGFPVVVKAHKAVKGKAVKAGSPRINANASKARILSQKETAGILPVASVQVPPITEGTPTT